MSERRPYAIDTDVPVDRTRAAIERLVHEHGGARFAYADTGTGAMIAFSLGDRLIRMTLPLPQKGQGQSDAKVAQMTRSAWRALLLALKGKLEAVARGITTAEREFLADTVMPGGKTVHEWAEPEIRRALAAGEPPALLVDYSAGAR